MRGPPLPTAALAGLGLALLLAILTLAANLTLMALSGWFITAMAVAGAAGGSLNYFTPAAMIRACAILRSLGRYGERLVGHDATFRLIAALRVWLFRRVEPLSPRAVARVHRGDLAGRLRVDLDRVEMAALRLALPLAAGLVTAAGTLAWIGWSDATAALLVAAALVAAGLGLPLALLPRAARAARDEARDRQALTEQAVDLVQGYLGVPLTPESVADAAASR